MSLATTYLGMKLSSPLIPGASPLSEDLDTVLRLEDAGAPAIVMSSLFEEQITHDELGTLRHMDVHGDSFVEAQSFAPPPPADALGPEQYLARVARLKERLDIPVIASLNGTTSGGWLSYAREIEAAGADALELNLYELATKVRESAAEVEARQISVIRAVVESVRIPVAVKISPFYSALASFAAEVERSGAGALVVFNRFYQADIDPEELEVRREIRLSDSSELLLRLRWCAILSAELSLPLAITGGVHSGTDVVKALMSGAQVVQVVAALLRHGPRQLTALRDELAAWMDQHGYSSVEELRGCMNLLRCPDPASYERANYIQVLQSW